MGDYYDASYETQCPQCRGTKYRNPQMKLMVNVCGHPMCDSCVRMYFIKGETVIANFSLEAYCLCCFLCFVLFFINLIHTYMFIRVSL